jgi:hypothetical protein
VIVWSPVDRQVGTFAFTIGQPACTYFFRLPIAYR